MTDRRLVVDDQDAPPGHGRVAYGLRLRRASTRFGKEELEARPAPLLRLDDEASAMAAGDAQGRREPEPPTPGLRREEGIEDVEPILVADPGAVVANFETDVAAPGTRLLRLEPAGGGGVELDDAGADSDPALPLWQRFGRVQHQIGDDLLQLAGVSTHTRLVGLQIEGQRRGGGHRGANDADGAANQLVHARRLRAQASAACVGEQLPGEQRRPLRRTDDRIEITPGRRIDRHLLPGQLGVAEHDQQQVVEVVGDAAGHPAEALQVLGLEQAVLEPLPLRHLELESGHALLELQPSAFALEAKGLEAPHVDAPPEVDDEGEDAAVRHHDQGLAPLGARRAACGRDEEGGESARDEQTEAQRRGQEQAAADEERRQRVQEAGLGKEEEVDGVVRQHGQGHREDTVVDAAFIRRPANPVQAHGQEPHRRRRGGPADPPRRRRLDALTVDPDQDSVPRTDDARCGTEGGTHRGEECGG